jgi:hypothetical protein
MAVGRPILQGKRGSNETEIAQPERWLRECDQG